MWEFLKANPFIVGAASGSLATYMLGLLVSYLRREKRWLGYQVSSRNIVHASHSKMSMKFDGQEIARLDSHTVQFRNIGNRALSKLPVRLTCGQGGRIVEHDITPPDGATFPADTSASQHLIVNIELLNPGEAFTVGLTVADAKTGTVDVVARAEYLELRQIGERENTEDLIQTLMPHLPFVGSLAFDLYKIFRTRRQRPLRQSAVQHGVAPDDKAPSLPDRG